IASDGKTLSHNLYWLAGDAEASRKLVDMPAQPVSLTARQEVVGSEVLVRATLTNTGSAPALTGK
ncbi:hypothetical protein, partial [Caulobacter sp. HMWF009]